MPNKFLILFFIFLVGAVFRFYALGDIPRGFHRDEAFLGYNAYSILKTGRDINGNLLPLHLQSFLYSPAGYSYAAIPFIMLFGLNAFSVRAVSAFCGLLTVVITYFLAEKLFQKHKYKNIIALTSSLFLAVSPWSINLNRTATENSLVICFIASAMLLYLHWIEKKKLIYLFFSFSLFFLTLFIYQAPRAFLPFFIPGMIWAVGKINKNDLLAVVFLFFISIMAPLFLILSSKDLSLRIRTVSIFSTAQSNLVLEDLIPQDGLMNIPRIETRLFHNKFIGYSQQFLQNYFKHFSYDFLFTDEGFPARYRVPVSGLLYIVDLPLLAIGTFYLAASKKREGMFLLLWVLAAPLGSALTFDDVPNLQRSFIMFPALPIVCGYGFATLYPFLLKRKIVFFSFAAVFIYGILFYMHQYYIHLSFYRPWYRNDGYKELVQKVDMLSSSYKKTTVTDRESAPTIFFLFYNRFDPLQFQKETKLTTMKDFDRINFSSFEFSQEECPLRKEKKDGALFIIGEKSMLYVDSGLCPVFDEMRVLFEVKRGDGSVAFRIVDLK